MFYMVMFLWGRSPSGYGYTIGTHGICAGVLVCGVEEVNSSCTSLCKGNSMGGSTIGYIF